MTDTGHNSGAVNAGQLRAFIERIESVEAEIADRNAEKSEIYKEARGTGFEVKVIRKIVSMRRQDQSKRREEEEILDLYLHSLGMVD